MNFYFYDYPSNKMNKELIQAIENNNLEKTIESINQGANIHTTDSLYLACSRNHINIAKYLIQKGANIQSDNNSCLIGAVYQGHVDVVELLLENGADVHVDNDEALRWSVIKNDLQMANLLVTYGANVEILGASDKEKLGIGVQGWCTRLKISFIFWYNMTTIGKICNYLFSGKMIKETYKK